MALLIFMRKGLTFSPVATVSSANSASKSTKSSSAGRPFLAVLPLASGLPEALGGLAFSALGLTGVFAAGLAAALTGADLAAGLAAGLAAALAAGLATGLAAVFATGLVGALAAGFAAVLATGLTTGFATGLAGAFLAVDTGEAFLGTGFAEDADGLVAVLALAGLVDFLAGMSILEKQKGVSACIESALMGQWQGFQAS